MEPNFEQKVVKAFSNSFAGKAVDMLKRKPKTLAFLAIVITRFSHVGPARSLATFHAAVRMLWYSVKGGYPHLPWKLAVALLGGLLYFVTPVDVVPDVIPFLGFADDAFILDMIFKLAANDISQFQAWESSAQERLEMEAI